MDDRRKFLRGVGLFGALAAGAATVRANAAPPVVINNHYTTVTGDEIPSEYLEKQIEAKPVLLLSATYGEEMPPTKVHGTDNMYIIGINPTYKPGTEKRVEVRLVPGPDGKLYVKENDTWRKL
jgi:hypothetical protein